jgi:hypothetical protein
MINKRTTILAATALSTVAVAGCGGGSSGGTVSAASYVKSVCSAVGPFEKDIQAKSSALDLSTIKSASQGKQALESFLNSATSDTKKAVDQLKSAGTPDVNNGKKIAEAIINAFSNLSDALNKAASQAQSLPTSSPTAFRDAAQALGTSVRNSMGSIGSGLTGLRNQDLEKAASKEPACQTIQG